MEIVNAEILDVDDEWVYIRFDLFKNPDDHLFRTTLEHMKQAYQAYQGKRFYPGKRVCFFQHEHTTGSDVWNAEYVGRSCDLREYERIR